MSRATALTLLLLACGACRAAGAGEAAGVGETTVGNLTKDTSPWWSHIQILASDEFQGRLTGSPGYRQAAEYVARTFQRFGLRPAGVDGYFQNVAFQVQQVRSVVVQLTDGEGASPRDVSASVVLSPGVLQPRETRAPLVFAGYGIHLPQAGYDDFAELDVRGAVIVYLQGGPESLSGVQRAYASAEVLPHYLEAAGAAGALRITLPKDREVPWERQKSAGAQPGMLLAEKALRRYQGPMTIGSFHEAQAESLFEGSGHRFAELVAAAEAHEALPHFRLKVGIDARVETSVSEASAANVVGELPGRDPSLGSEAVVLSAHLDHLGTGKPDHGDGIFHGAMDDASGVATLLETARAFARAKTKPRRSILFVAVCGEEKGLLGSRYFVAHPARHAGHWVADINTDMFLPLYPLHRVVGYGADESSLGDDIRSVGATLGVELAPDPQPDHLVFVRSDQYNFVRRGTPAVMLSMAPRPGTAEEATYKEWFSERYHAQADDLDQPIDLVAAEAFDRLIYRLARRLADAPKAPSWRPESFFAAFAVDPLP